MGDEGRRRTGDPPGSGWTALECVEVHEPDVAYPLRRGGGGEGGRGWGQEGESVDAPCVGADREQRGRRVQELCMTTANHPPRRVSRAWGEGEAVHARYAVLRALRGRPGRAPAPGRQAARRGGLSGAAPGPSPTVITHHPSFIHRPRAGVGTLTEGAGGGDGTAIPIPSAALIARCRSKTGCRTSVAPAAENGASDAASSESYTPANSGPSPNRSAGVPGGADHPTVNIHPSSTPGAVGGGRRGRSEAQEEG